MQATTLVSYGLTQQLCQSVNETYTAQVSGVLQKIGGFGLGGPSDTGVYMPLTQAESFFGTNQCDMIIVQLKNSDNATISNVSKAHN